MYYLLNKIFILFFVFLFSFYSLEAAPKREIRAIWIATVGNIDWPSKKGLSSDQQKAEFIRKINMAEQLGFNTLIVQIRPAADALYESSYEPWSMYLSGKQGQPPFPYYDPLKFMIEEAHKRNMELHALFNPYRALVSSKSNPNPASHPTKKNSDWIIHYEGKSYFDPGNPSAREYILKVMLEVVQKYDIDAVHIDDYFYPYPSRGKEFGDQSSYAKYGSGMSKGDWRRNNVNTFISLLNSNIKKIKPHVKFGVSPFGIWRNQGKDPSGSATNGTSCYDDLYSDVRLWMQNKWVDYMAPQLYWERGHKVADYSTLLDWWAQNKAERQLVVGLGIYKMVGVQSGVWSGSSEILGQIKDGRAKKIHGFACYSLVSFEKVGSRINEQLKKPEYFGTIAIPPTMPWIDNIPPPAPEVIVKSKTATSIELSWKKQKDQNRFLIYKFNAGESINLEDASKIVILTSQTTYKESHSSGGKSFYVITALDRGWNESEPAQVVL